MMTLGQALALLPEARLVGDPALAFTRVHTDTRTLQPGDLFVALRGERFDAHDFLSGVREAGAVAALAQHGLAAAGLSGLEVPDTLAALQRLAQAWRRRWSGALVAVAGSNGKTTVTQMVGAILRAAHGEAALVTQGNLNNHIGVPLTLLRLRVDGPRAHRAAVVEIGMNHPGEIAPLAAIAAPTVALVNNAQREHQEFMDGVEAVARENGAVLEALPADGVAVFPADDPMAPVWRAQAASRRVWTFGLSPAPGAADAVSAAPAALGVDLTAIGRWDGAALAWPLVLHTPAGTCACRLRLPGAHNVRNALAAAGCALAAGCTLDEVVRGLEAFEPVRGRSQIATLRWAGREITLVDDSYNANPDSVLAALAVLAGLPGPRWAVLGDMAEVGMQGPAFHAEVGERARALGIEHLWAVGELGAHTTAAAAGPGTAARHFASIEALLQALHAAPPAAGALLVKGSRAARMERVVQAVHDAAQHPPALDGAPRRQEAPCC
jgi:UDP-N-acetylmuramoyl-tripeptide--D-alanyl-D-alanine ligase